MAHAVDGRGPRFVCPASGVRFYGVEAADGRELAVPGVTSVLGVDASDEDRRRLEDWRLKEIAEGRDPKAGANRGTACHALLEDHIRGLPFLPEEQEEWGEVHRYSSGMEKHLLPYKQFLWNERPLVTGWDRCWSKPDANGKRLARVWSERWGFAGTPDLLARRHNNLLILGDFKTSTKPYYRCSGSRVPQWKLGGYLKYKKTVKQLCAYKLAFEEMFDVKIDYLQIIVGLPEIGQSQMFFIRKVEMETETELFKRACVRFWQKHQSHQLLAV
jgi:hypothetical protein